MQLQQNLTESPVALFKKKDLNGLLDPDIFCRITDEDMKTIINNPSLLTKNSTFDILDLDEFEMEKKMILA